ncbi:hemolysin family protein [Longimicrobium sp.]|jgi:CBS domain containing-hemolysin-like protein|uniref:hemolysin family protein n=1 Tax=Longimicrobium sp. TaxID=2029185 RepID=UPI002F945FA9
MDKVVPLVIITVLILLNALFVAAEFAIVGAPRASIERRAAEGDAAARIVSNILKDPRRQDRYIATAQLGITVASLGLGMYGEHVLAEWIGHWLVGLGPLREAGAHTLASVLAVALLTYFHIVVGEMIPKSIALQQADKAAVWVTPPVLVVQKILYPLVIGLNALGNAVLRLAGINRYVASGEHYRTPEELQFIVRESQAGGMLRQESADVLQELLEFGDLTAGEVMIPRVHVVGIPAGATADEMLDILRSSPHTRYPVYEGSLDHITGVVHIKDILRRMPNRRALRPSEVREVPYIPETAEMDTVLAAMRRVNSQMAVVMDEHGGTAGVITIEDLFEEVVGEIEEGWVARPEIHRALDGRLLVAGTVRISQVGEELGLVLEHDEVDTVSGLVLSLLDRPPLAGDVVEYDDVRFEVTAVEGHGVSECAVTPLLPPEGAEDAPRE